MGTRADFYVGQGEGSEYLGSIAFDGYVDGIPNEILQAETEEKFRTETFHFISERRDGTLPADGWPWPWEDSRTTDYAYSFDDGKVHCSIFGHETFIPGDGEEVKEGALKNVIFPNMKAVQKVTMGKRSGLMVIGIGPNGADIIDGDS